MKTFAVIKTGGKQYRVAPGQRIRIEKLDAAEGAAVRFDEVLLVADGDRTDIGMPTVKGASVEAKVLSQGRDRKKIVFKYHRKTRYRKKKGHRQPFTEVEIQEIGK
ncbi:MAG: 50S ribosomal protein L21 [Candidatus Sungbacteria bacterium RIFCSPLOWO2_01_FULL_60_25]|uniref:Large ribosomal subunit protein bL21 n=1 Tax=Candidatus Sungbacteria bacterium RIFCSPLOWO2_01_FULL_60_25 TaxID=1802281 RepID=A0A1G2LDK7_9BACT|nr:MAG: 50S ribosomal protein L21 [Candidatus Sungbacteria bacterium RIFCSPLOWO2_01_FULL_60_25]